jgi:hypothetical protein
VGDSDRAEGETFDLRLVISGFVAAVTVVLVAGYALLSSADPPSQVAVAISDIAPGDDAEISTHDLDDNGTPDVAVINGQTVDIPQPTPARDWYDRWSPLIVPLGASIIVALGPIVVALLNRAERGRVAELSNRVETLSEQVEDLVHYLGELSDDIDDVSNHVAGLSAGAD